MPLNKLTEKEEVCDLQTKTPKAKTRNKEYGLQLEMPKKKNPKEVIGIMNSMKRGFALVKDSEVSVNGLNDHEINMRYDEPRDDICPSRRVLKGVCPSMMTRKDQEIDQKKKKPMKNMMNLRMGVCPQCKIVTNIRQQNVTIQDTLEYAQ